MHLPDSKTGKRTVLNSAAVAILEGLDRAKDEIFVPYGFVSQITGSAGRRPSPDRQARHEGSQLWNW